MNKQFIYIILIVIFVMFFGFITFYFLDEVQPQNTDPRPIPLKIIKVKEAEASSGEVRPEIKIDDLIPKDEIITAKPIEELPKEKVKVLIPGLSEKIIVSDLQKETQRIFEHVQSLKALHQSKKSAQMIELIKKELSHFNLTHDKTKLFLVDYDGNTLLGENSQEDIHARTILLEEIHKVRRYGEGSIVSTVDPENLKRYIYVKKLAIHKLFIGVDRYERGVKK